MRAKDWPRLALTAFILLIFGYAVLQHYSEAIEQTVLAITMLSVGYWLGSSKGSADKTELLETRPTGNPDDPVFVEGEE